MKVKITVSIEDAPLLQEHKHLVLKRIKEATNYLTQSKCTSFDEYKKQCGIIAGLRQSLDLMTEAIKTYTNDDDEEL